MDSPGSRSRFSVTIPSTSVGRDDSNKTKTFVLYDVVILMGTQEWKASVRYSTFDVLHDQVKDNYPNLRMPKLPPKRAFGNDKQEFIERRRVGLQAYLQELLSYQNVRGGPEIAALFKLPTRISSNGGLATNSNNSPPSTNNTFTAATVPNRSLSPGPGPLSPRGGSNPLNPATTLELDRAKCIHDYVDESGNMVLKAGDEITVIEVDDNTGWWFGETDDKSRQFYFPGTFVTILGPHNSAPPAREQQQSGPSGVLSPRQDSSYASQPAARARPTPPPRVVRGPGSNSPGPTRVSLPALPPTPGAGGPPSATDKKMVLPKQPIVPADALNANNRLRKVELPGQPAQPPQRDQNQALKRASSEQPIAGGQQAPQIPKRLGPGAGGLPQLTRMPSNVGGSPSPRAPLPARPAGEPAGDKRTLIANEILSTEKAYVEQLTWLVSEYMAKITELYPKLLKEIFSNVELILGFHTAILAELTEHMSSWNPDTTKLGETFKKLAPFLRLYKDYGSNFERATETVNRIRENAISANALDEVRTKCQNLTLDALLITPIQRLPRYEMLLQDFFRNTPENHPDYKSLGEAVNLIKNVSAELNEAIRDSEKQRKFGDLAQGDGFRVLLEPSRRLILDGTLPLLRSKNKKDNNFKLYLFNDKIVPARITRGVVNPYVIVPLNLTWIGVDSREKEISFDLITPEGVFTFVCPSEGEKQSWVTKIREGILSNLTDKSQGTSIPERRVCREESPYTYSINSEEGSTYYGQWMNGRRSGTGTMRYFSGNKYEGEWEADLRTRKGVLTYRTGEMYDGEWKDDKFHGVGILHYRIESPTSNIRTRYEGRWANGMRDGQGILHFSNGDVLDGRWIADRTNGVCQIKYADGSEFSGQFEESRRKGIGEFRGKDKSRYTGNWDNDRRHGQGTFDDGHGNIYEGEWHDDRRHGQGTQTYSTGHVYSGGWHKDARDGQGKYKCPGGDLYEGTWKDDKRNGNGTWTTQDGHKYDGEWANGRRHGKGTHHYPNGDKQEGGWAADKPHGNGTLTKKDGTKLEGKWAHGVREGRYTIQCAGEKESFSGMCTDNAFLINSSAHKFEIAPSTPDPFSF